MPSRRRSNPPAARGSPGNPLLASSIDPQPYSSFENLISVFERIEKGEESTNLSSSLKNLTLKLSLGVKGPEKDQRGRNSVSNDSRRRPKTTNSVASGCHKGLSITTNASQSALHSQSMQQLPRMSSAATPFRPGPGSPSSQQSPLNRPSATAANFRSSPLMSPEPDEPPDALDLFEDDAPQSPSSSQSSTASPTMHSPTSTSPPAQLQLQQQQQSSSPSARPSRRRSQSEITSNSSPLPPIMQALNSTEDEYTSEFYGDILNADISSLYKTLDKRARTVHGTRRASTGLIEPALASVAAQNDSSNRFNMYTHTIAEARVLKSSHGSRAVRTAGQKKRPSPYDTTTKTTLKRTKEEKKVEKPSTAAATTKRIRFVAPSDTDANPSAFSRTLLRPATSAFDSSSLLSKRAQSPYHEMNALSSENFQLNRMPNRSSSPTQKQSDIAPRPNTVSLLSRARDNVVVNETTKAMRDSKISLVSSLKDEKSAERSLFYTEVKNVVDYRKKLPLAFLASKMLKNGRRKTKNKKAANNDDDASVNSITSYASSTSLAVEMESDDVELMRLAVGKVVDGFMRMILEYYSEAWKSFLRVRDHSRQLECIAKATQIQCWFRGMWGKLAVKRRKEEIRLEEVRQARLRELERLDRIAKATKIEALGRQYNTRKMYLDKLRTIAAAIVIQKAWERKKVVDKGMGEVTKYWFRQDSALIIQCAVRSHKARLLTSHHRRAKRHTYFDLRYATMGSVIRTNFEMQGAAAKIQRWFRRLPYRMRIMTFRLKLRKVKMIQRWWWNQRAKNSTIAKLLGFRAEITRRENAGFKITPIVRGGIVRLHIKRIKREEDAVRQVEIDAVRLEQKLAHKAERKKRHAALDRNRGIFSRFQNTMHLDEFNPIIMQKHKTAAIVIQKHARRILAVKIAADLRVKKLKLSAIRLQRKFKHYTFKKARWKATVALQMLWVKVKRRRAMRHRLIIKIQAVYRGKKDREKVKAFVALWNPTAVVLQRCVRGSLARLRIENFTQNLYWMAEFKRNGKLLYNITLDEEVRRQIFYHTTHYRNPSHEAEMQFIFGHYCSYGDKSNHERLGVNMFTKFIKECGMITKKMNQTTFELLFTHEMGHDNHFINYKQFITLLKAIAEQRYPKVNVHGTMGTYKGPNARLMHMLEADVLKVKEIKRFLKDLGAERAEIRAKRNIVYCCEKIQHTWRESCARSEWETKFLSTEKALSGAKRLKALQTIQTSWRAALGRMYMRKIGVKLYQKIIDDHHGGQVYYYNVKTGSATWKKPIFLGKYDIDNPIKLPSDDRLYKKVCDYCGITAATWFDITGNENFCEDCNEVVHSKNNKRDNVCVRISNCIQCEFQVATKFCVQCKDLYCDTCYFDQHKRGMLQKHYYDKVQSHCDVCKKYVALLKVDPGDKSYCKVCYKKEHPWDVRFEQDNAANEGVTVSHYAHQPAEVHAYYQKLAEEERRKVLEAEFEERKKVMDIIAREKAVRLIQRTFRGMKGRRRGAIIMASRRQTRLQREKDELVRARLSYQLKLVFGNAPKLPSDTTKEKVLKRFPMRYYKLVTDVVHGDWEGSWQLVDAHEKFLATHKERVGFRKRLKENTVIVGYLLLALYQRRRVKRLLRRKDRAQVKYRSARSAVGFDAKKKEELKMEMRRTKNKWNKGQKKHEKTKEKVEGKRQVIRDRKGPEGFEKKMKQVRKEGVRLQWRKKDIKWKLQQYSDVVVPEDEAVDVFKSKMLAIGSRIRLGDKDRHGLRMVYIKSHLHKLTAWDKIQDRINATIDPDSQKIILQKRKDFHVQWDNKHLKVTRQWMHEIAGVTIGEDGEGEGCIESSELFLHKMPRELWWAKKKIKGKEWMRNNALSQFVIGRTFRFLGRVVNLCHDMSTKFDEDSSTTTAFKRRLAYYRAMQERVLMMSNTVIKERAKGARRNKLHKMFDAFDRFKNQAKIEAKQLLESLMKKKKAKVIDPFVQWDASEDKAEIRVNWTEEGDNTKNVKLGEIKCDVDAPANVAREYCRRFLREELNSRVGERFLLVAKGEGLPILEESQKRIGQLAPQKFNAETREIEHTLNLTANKDTELEPLQIPVIKSEDLKRQEEEMKKKRLYSLAIEERKYKEVEMSDELKEALTKEMANAGLSEKKIKKLFSREGKLISLLYNDITRNMEMKRRKKFKTIIDECLGIDTQGEHNFKIGGGAQGASEASPDGDKQANGASPGKTLSPKKDKEGEEKKGKEEVEERKVEEQKVEENKEELEEEDWDDYPDVGAADAPNAWEEYKDNQGYSYYYNSQTGESQYEVPEGWQQ